MTDPAVPPQPAGTPVPPTGAPPTAPVSTLGAATGATAVGGAAPGPPPSQPAPLPAGQLATGPLPGRPPAVPPAAVPSAAPAGPPPSAGAARRRSGPLTRMGPWAPVAGAALGLAAGLVAAVLLAGRAEAFAEELALVLLVVGLTLLGAAGVLLADEVRLLHRGTRDAGVRPSWVEATAGLVNGLTPARLLLATSAFVLFLAAYTGR